MCSRAHAPGRRCWRRGGAGPARSRGERGTRHNHDVSRLDPRQPRRLTLLLLLSDAPDTGVQLRPSAPDTLPDLVGDEPERRVAERDERPPSTAVKRTCMFDTPAPRETAAR